jgi:hypothetical protein
MLTTHSAMPARPPTTDATFMFVFSRLLSPGEILMGLLSVVGFVLAIIGNITGTARGPTLITLVAVTGILLLGLLVALTRQTYVITGYKNTMALLETLARRASQSIWTARTHRGTGSFEERYFNIIRERMIASENPLEDFRRVVRIGGQAGSDDHLLWLVQAFADQPAARVKVFEGGGPSFDFVVFDGETAVIGLPQSGGLDNAAGIVIRGRSGVAGVAAVFDALLAESTELFVGNRHITDGERAHLVAKCRDITATAGVEVERLSAHSTGDQHV